MIPDFLRPYLIAASVAAGLAMAWTAYRTIEGRGHDRALIEQAHGDRERTDAANAANDDARRCAIDASCVMRPDQYRRD